jgi:hypothetical protein
VNPKVRPARTAAAGTLNASHIAAEQDEYSDETYRKITSVGA